MPKGDTMDKCLHKCPMCGSENVVCTEKSGLVCKDCSHVWQELSKEDEKQLEKASDVV